MQVTNWKNPGDAPLPADTSVRDEACAKQREEIVKTIAESLFDARMASSEWISDAQGNFSQAEYDAITEAIKAGDAMKVGMLTLQATWASIRRSSAKDVAESVERLERNGELHQQMKVAA